MLLKDMTDEDKQRLIDSKCKFDCDICFQYKYVHSQERKRCVANILMENDPICLKDKSTIDIDLSKLE